MYYAWCDDDGKVIDDGTIARLGEDRFRITAAEPNLAWFQDFGYGLDVTVEDVSESLAALAVHGLLSRQLLKVLAHGVDLDTLKYYRLAQANLCDLPIEISRTGYTGDLGYELWTSPAYAGELWDFLIKSGVNFGLFPAGTIALDIARI